MGLLSEIIKEVAVRNPDLGEMLETSLPLVPYLGKIYQMVKFQRLQKRLKENEVKLQRLALIFRFYFSENI